MTEDARSGLLPDVPAVAETLPGFEVTSWYGVFAPRGLPAATQKTHDEVNRIAALPEIVQRFRPLGMVRPPMSPGQMNEVLMKEAAMWAATIKSLPIVPE